MRNLTRDTNSFHSLNGIKRIEAITRHHYLHKTCHTIAFSFPTNEPSNLFLLFARCFWVNTIKPVRMISATTIITHTTTRVTTIITPIQLLPIDHNPRMLYSQMHSSSFVNPCGTTGSFPSTRQRIIAILLSSIITLSCLPINCFM